MNNNNFLHLSLRGSLAQQYFDFAYQGNWDKAKEYASYLMKSPDPDIEKRIEGELLVIGKVSERGHFFPDW